MTITDKAKVSYVVGIKESGDLQPIRRQIPYGVDAITVGIRPSVSNDTFLTHVVLNMLDAGFTVGAPKEPSGKFRFTGLSSSLTYTFGRVSCENKREAGTKQPASLTVKTWKVDRLEGATKGFLRGFLKELQKANDSKMLPFIAEATTKDSGFSVEPRVKRLRVEEESPAGQQIPSDHWGVNIYRELRKLYPSSEEKIRNLLQKTEDEITGIVETALQSEVAAEMVPFPEVPYLNNSCFISTTISMLLATSKREFVKKDVYTKGEKRGKILSAILKCLKYIASNNEQATENGCIMDIVKMASFLKASDPNFVRIEDPEDNPTLIVGFCNFDMNGFVTEIIQDDITRATDIFMNLLSFGQSDGFYAKRCIKEREKMKCTKGHESNREAERDLVLTLAMLNKVRLTKKSRLEKLKISSLVKTVFNIQPPEAYASLLCESCANGINKEGLEERFKDLNISKHSKDTILQMFGKSYRNSSQLLLAIKAKMSVKDSEAINEVIFDCIGVTKSTTQIQNLNTKDVFMVNLGVELLWDEIDFEDIDKLFTIHEAGINYIVQIKAFAVKVGGISCGHWFSVVRSTEEDPISRWAIVNGRIIREFETAKFAFEAVKTRYGKLKIPFVVIEVLRLDVN